MAGFLLGKTRSVVMTLLMIIPSQKHLFDMPDAIAYLNNAYMSPLMHKVVSAMTLGIESKVRPWTYKAEDFFTHAETARALAAKIWGGPADNVAIVPSASYGLQVAANALPLKAGQHVLVLAEQFPSNIYPWQAKATAVGAEVKVLPTPDNDDWTKIVLKAVSSSTAILAIPQTHWSSGATLDLVAIRTALDKVGGALVLDLTQSLGAQPFDAMRIKPDFAVAATYKWLMGPYSLGFLYVDPKWHSALPLENNWMNRLGSEDFTGLTQYQEAFQAGARRFDMGEKSNPAQLMGASAALQQIIDWGIDNIAETLAQKTKRIAQSISSDKIRPVADQFRAPHYLGVRFQGGVPEGLSESLATQKIFISVRGPLMRVTPHLYADDNDIDRFITHIKRF